MTTESLVGKIAKKSYIALVHYPVYDKNRKIVATSITNLDIHDIARSGKTYGLAGYFIVHPVAVQRELAQRIIGHWRHGPGQEQNDFRREALEMVRVTDSTEHAVAQITAEHNAPPLVVGTSAHRHPSAVQPTELVHDAALQNRPMLLMFGTGWGMTSELLEQADRLLCPIKGITVYNHLSVRSAAAIILDRLFAEPDPNSGENRP